MARPGVVVGAIAALLAAALVLTAPAAAQVAGSTAGDPDALTVPPIDDRPPPGRARAAREVLRTAERLPRVRRARRDHPRTYARAFLKGPDRWQVTVYAQRRDAPDEEIAQVVVDDRTGEVLETWTGIQVAWTMARGYPGAFGRKVNAPYVWLPLLLAFLAPFARRPLRLVHLDLAVVASLSISYWLFCQGRIGLSVPLAYPPLLYLLARLLWIARVRGRAGPSPAPLGLRLGPDALAFGIIFLLGFRLGLNLTASNVIDVGYAGVIGADRITGGAGLYGDFPADNPHGDTYGPVNYLAYVPFELVAPWGGEWDDLPAAHGAAIAFDLATALLAFLLGRRLRDTRLGLLLAYLWLACPFSVLVANSNANDALVGALVLLALVLAGRPVARGAALATAGLAKFAPLALAPLLATHPRRDGAAAARTAAGFTAAAAALLGFVAALDGGLVEFAERTVGFQLGRDSPFSVWGLWGIPAGGTIVLALAAALAIAVALVPRRRDDVSLCALAAAVLIALQLGVAHWFYLYIAWFLVPALAAVVSQPDAGAARSRPRGGATSTG